MRNKQTVLKVIFLGLASLSLFVSSAQANRRISLADNLLIEDKDDVYQYPQRMLDYRNAVSLDMGGSGNSGRVLFLGGWDDLALGFSAEQTAPYSALSGPLPADLMTYESTAFYAGSGINPFPITSVSEAFLAVAPFTLIDAFLAVPTGAGSFGLRLGFGTRGLSGTVNDVDSGFGENLITLEAGLSGGNEARFDTSLNLALNLGSGENGTVYNMINPAFSYSFEDVSSTLIRVSLSGRGYIPYSDNIDVGLLGNLVVASSSITPDPVGAATELSMNTLALGVMGGAGPVFHVTDLTEVAAYGVIGLSYVSAEPNDEVDDDGFSDVVIYIPGVRVAADIGLTEWFFVRTGVQYSFQFASTSYENDDSSNRGDGSLGWTAGLGVEHNGFTLDGALYQGWITAGPDFIGGDPIALFGVVSAGYNWL
ncbi:MAG: hypothetical protein ABIG68_14460 [Acidobacteriota bacterium]